jgi:hypothetical protein
MRASKWTLVFIILASTAMVDVAQQRDSTNPLSVEFPVPLWPANGVIPPELKTNYVFLDLAKNEYVVAYPQNLGSPDFEKDGPGQRDVMRFPMQRNVDPKVIVALTPANGGKVKYAYTIADSPSAKQAIDQWVLVLPDSSDIPSIKQPAGWFGIFQKGRKFSVANPDWIKSGNAAVFSFEKLEEHIQPGGVKGGFEITCDLKPGFTLGYFRQTESTDAVFQASGNIPFAVIKNATPPPPPGGAAAGGRGGGFGNQTPAAATAAWKPIKEEVEKLQSFEYNSKTLLILGPKFDKNATDQTIASDFVQGITTLGQMGSLSADSAFVKGTLSDLNAFVNAGGSGQLKLSAQPKGDAETEVFNAMKLSLHLN